MDSLLSAMNFSNSAWATSSSAASFPEASYKLFLISLNLAITYWMAPESANSYLVATAIKAFKKATSVLWVFCNFFWVSTREILAFLT